MGLDPSTSAALPGNSGTTWGCVDGDAIRAAKLQKKGLPWSCRKIGRVVTNAECSSRPDPRRCRDCSIPHILPKEDRTVTKKNVEMGHTFAAEPREPSWDDFPASTRPADPDVFTAHIQGGAERMTMTAPLCRKMGWNNGDIIEVRVLPGRIACKPVKGAIIAVKGTTYKAQRSSRTDTLQLSCKVKLREAGAKGGEVCAVELTTWGCIVHLDKPMDGEGA